MADEDAEQLADEGLDVQVPEPESLDEGGSVAQEGPQQPAQLLVTEAAFIVFLDSQGHWMADSGVINRPIQVARESNFIDMHNACTTIIKDIVVQETARQVVGLQQQVAQQVAEQMRTRQLAESLGGPVGDGLKQGPSGLFTK